MKMENISLAYGDKKILDSFSVEFPQKGKICLFAPSGAGKTTILHLLCGLIHPDRGRILGTKDKKFAPVFQEDRLIASLTAQENIEVVLKKKDSNISRELLFQLGLGGREQAYPEELSGGMKRRVAIARALAYGSEYPEQAVYLMDEPLKGLDEKTACQTTKIIDYYCKDSLLIFVSHDRAQAQEMADQMLFLEGEPVRISKIWHKNKGCTE